MTFRIGEGKSNRRSSPLLLDLHWTALWWQQQQLGLQLQQRTRLGGSTAISAGAHLEGTVNVRKVLLCAVHSESAGYEAS